MILVLLVSVLSLGSVVAQDRLFAVSGQGRGGAGDARQAAQISALENENNKANACTASNLIYAPTHSGANADGCISFFPSGAVMAFNLSSCPSGWSALANAEGRFIIGRGTLGSDTYSLGGTGGSARHTLTVSEMPSHDHDVGIPGWTPSYVEFDYVGGSGSLGGVKGDGRGPFLDIYPRGGNQPHENRPPYLALLYCQKD